MSDRIYSRQFHATEGVEAWRVLPEGAYAYFGTDSFAASVRFVDAIGPFVFEGRPGPQIDIRRGGVTVLIGAFKDTEYGLVRTDLDLARAITKAAQGLGLAGDPTAIQSLSIIPGATDRRSIMPVWRAVLGYEPRQDSPDEDLVDPRDRGPSFWFEPMDEPRPDGGGAIHIAVWVAPEEAEARLAAALAAGGRLVRDRSPAWWTLADAAGNEVDIATTEGRD